jgi:hypothetical protein
LRLTSTGGGLVGLIIFFSLGSGSPRLLFKARARNHKLLIYKGENTFFSRFEKAGYFMDSSIDQMLQCILMIW